MRYPKKPKRRTETLDIETRSADQKLITWIAGGGPEALTDDNDVPRRGPNIQNIPVRTEDGRTIRNVVLGKGILSSKHPDEVEFRDIGNCSSCEIKPISDEAFKAHILATLDAVTEWGLAEKTYEDVVGSFALLVAPQSKPATEQRVSALQDSRLPSVYLVENVTQALISTPSTRLPKVEF